MLSKLLTLVTRKNHLASLVPYLARYKTRLLVGSLMVALTNLAAVTIPWVLRNAIDHLRVEINSDLLVKYSLLIVSISIVEGFFRYLMRHILIGVSRNIEYDLRNNLFCHLQSLSQSFYDRNHTGDLKSFD